MQSCVRPTLEARPLTHLCAVRFQKITMVQLPVVFCAQNAQIGFLDEIVDIAQLWKSRLQPCTNLWFVRMDFFEEPARLIDDRNWLRACGCRTQGDESCSMFAKISG